MMKKLLSVTTALAKKRWGVIALGFLLLVGGLTVTANAFAAEGVFSGIPLIGGVVDVTIGGIVSVIIMAVGQLYFLVLKVLVYVANYQGFTNSLAVETGWTIMRDMANMFFVLILLVIAVGTILQKDQYSYKKLLGSMILAAILINFSKTICGFIIDFSQVVMLTFVNSFSDSVGGNISSLLGIVNLMKVSQVGGAFQAGTTPASINGISLNSNLIMALVFAVVALTTVTTMVGILIVRLVGLWFLIVLSPWAFLLSLIPRGQKYASKWWDSFINLAILGPVMMFFFWLSMSLVSQVSVNVNQANQVHIARLLGQKISDKVDNDDFRQGLTEVGTVQGALGFALGIGMLVATMAAATELGSGAGKFAGKFIGDVQDWGAGKKGLSPMSIARKRFDAYRKKRMEALEGKANALVGTVLTAPGKTFGAIARGIMTNKTAQAAGAQWDKYTRGGWGVLVGNGRDWKKRKSDERAHLEDEALKKLAKAGEKKVEIEDLSHAAAEADKRAVELKEQADDFRSRAAALPVGDPTATKYLSDATALDAQSKVKSDEAIKFRSSEHRMGLFGEMAELENGAQMDRLKAFGINAVLAAPGLSMKALKLGVGISGIPSTLGMSMLSTHFTDMMGAVHKEGEAMVLEAEHAQSSAISKAMGDFSKKTVEQIRAIANGTVPGLDSAVHKMAALGELMRRTEHDPAYIKEVRKQMSALGANSSTLEEFEANVLNYYPTEAIGMTEDKLKELIERKRIPLDKLTEKSITPELLRAYSQVSPSYFAKLLLATDRKVRKGANAQASSMISESNKKFEDSLATFLTSKGKAGGTWDDLDEDEKEEFSAKKESIIEYIRDNKETRYKKDYGALLRVYSQARGGNAAYGGYHYNDQGKFQASKGVSADAWKKIYKFTYHDANNTENKNDKGNPFNTDAAGLAAVATNAQAAYMDPDSDLGEIMLEDVMNNNNYAFLKAMYDFTEKLYGENGKGARTALLKKIWDVIQHDKNHPLYKTVESMMKRT